ncbi:uncharacterized protein L3040_007213 [Drepanopeziza brunnea f. sp. 'multigermtubi']|uniref:uncharacterized protein n=1 Tax=Drepanopeziza brunnea f. sp. 'multigermtubi' TaxID=698441 RepID=UPI00238CA1B3|nr:hypothetical protein L3040_007213 [Drepanopeziza brunnea f. sp. 'multigermtubi']
MPRSTSKSLSTHDQALATLERTFQVVLVVILGAVIYRYCWVDVSDPFKCSALQNQGRWLDPSPGWNSKDFYKHWQPPGCMMHEYTKNDIQECFHTKRLVFIGDSTTRQIFWAVAKKMDKQRAENEMQEMLAVKEKRTDIAFVTGGLKIQFLWDPWLNSTRLTDELTAFRAYSPVKPQEPSHMDSAGLLLLGTPGLWYARHGQENYFKEFKDSIDVIIPHMDHLSQNDSTMPVPMTLASRQQSPNLLLLAPIQVPQYEALSPSRVETMTPEKIDLMNDYIQQVSAHSTADVIWSYSLMTWDGKVQYEESGLHVIENVARAKAEVLLNLRCNADAASRGYPFDRTCCSNYTQPGRVQWLLILAGMLAFPTMLITRRRRITQVARFLPQPEVLSALAVFGLVLCYCFYADRTQIFDKGHKLFQHSQFLIACLVVIIAGVLSIRKNREPAGGTKIQDLDFLSRDQTDEWKGWMQFIVLFYHYTHASQHLGIYQIIRLFIAAYLFMTGFGHTVFFLKQVDYSFHRVAAVLVRLNLLSCVLPYMMRTDYLFYYFAPLVSFWFLVVYFTLKIAYHKNSNFNFLLGKILVSATLTTALTKIPGVLEFVATVLNYTCAISWNVTEWRFRTFLDMYIVFVGMLIAALYLRYSRIQSGAVTPNSITDYLIQLTITYRFFKALLIAVALGIPPGLWVLLRKSHTKEDYNWWQPGISFIPILCFIVLRNSTRIFRNYHFVLFAWLGRFSLETYILQYHIWLAGDAKGLLRLGIWDSRVETLLLTAVFFWVSWHTAEATQTLTRWIVGASSGAPGLTRESSDDTEKNPSHLLPKFKGEDEVSLSTALPQAGDGVLERVMGKLGTRLELRLGLILFLLRKGIEWQLKSHLTMFRELKYVFKPARQVSNGKFCSSYFITFLE